MQEKWGLVKLFSAFLQSVKQILSFHGLIEHKKWNNKLNRVSNSYWNPKPVQQFNVSIFEQYLILANLFITPI